MIPISSNSVVSDKLRDRAESKLRKQAKSGKAKNAKPGLEADPERLLHELQVHHLELEMQNVELTEARDQMESLLEKYTDFYDFAPVGYFSIDEQGQILEVNLTGATLLNVGRSSLMKSSLATFVSPEHRMMFLGFLKKIFSGEGKQVCEVMVLKARNKSFWADFQGIPAASSSGLEKWCRVVVSDITALKRAEEAQERSNTLAALNEELRQEIVRRHAGEESLRKSEQHQIHLLRQSNAMQEQLRDLSRQVLLVQEDERKRISRELHDVIAQTLTGINIRLTTLKKEAETNPKNFDRHITQTQKLVEKSVNLVHQFARELRPAVLDDFGLVPALHTFMKIFATRTGIHTHLTAFAGLEKLDTDRRTVFFRVAQEALNNVAKHAGASKVEIKITKMPRGVCMIIQDDGKSFDVERVLHANRGKRLGLLGMRERLEMFSGKFEIESSPRQGTAIKALLPWGKGGHGRLPKRNATKAY